MTICVIDGGHCVCNPEEGLPCIPALNMNTALAASQAREAKLREALDEALGCIDGYYRTALDSAFATSEMAYDDSALKELLAEGQAREAKLRECLHNCYGVDEDGVEYINYSTIEEALALPSDDSALRETIKVEYARGYDDGFLVGAEKGRNISEELNQAKREALLEAAEWFENIDSEGRSWAVQLRRMAEEIK
jgi:hypothetical protein